MEQILSSIANVGFPIVAFFVIVERLDKMNKEHSEREVGWQKTLQNNTIVMHELLHEIKEMRKKELRKDENN